MRVRYSPRAIQNLRSIFAYIDEESPQAAADVVARIERVGAELGHAPHMGIATSTRGIHRFPVSGTPYLIFYEIYRDEVAIIHIRHGARHPWAGQR